MHNGLIAVAIGSVLLISGCAGMTYAPVKYRSGVMTGLNGMTLYTFDKDVEGSGKSVCNGPCATAWPPFIAASNEPAGGDWAVITRDDGTRQWTYSGKPLYYYAKDQKPGDVAGEGFNNVWHAVPTPLVNYDAGNMNGP